MHCQTAQFINRQTLHGFNRGRGVLKSSLTVRIYKISPLSLSCKIWTALMYILSILFSAFPSLLVDQKTVFQCHSFTSIEAHAPVRSCWPPDFTFSLPKSLFGWEFPSTAMKNRPLLQGPCVVWLVRLVWLVWPRQSFPTFALFGGQCLFGDNARELGLHFTQASVGKQTLRKKSFSPPRSPGRHKIKN